MMKDGEGGKLSDEEMWLLSPDESSHILTSRAGIKAQAKISF